MWRAVNYNVEACPLGRPEGAGGQLDLRGCLVDRSGSGRGIDSGRTEEKKKKKKRGHQDEFTEEAV
jgi:hypothetical protein